MSKRDSLINFGPATLAPGASCTFLVNPCQEFCGEALVNLGDEGGLWIDGLYVGARLQAPPNGRHYPFKVPTKHATRGSRSYQGQPTLAWDLETTCHPALEFTLHVTNRSKHSREVNLVLLGAVERVERTEEGDHAEIGQ